MQTTIEKILTGKSIQVSQWELDAITAQWQNLQKLKAGFGVANLDESDIALTYDLGSAYHE